MARKRSRVGGEFATCARTALGMLLVVAATGCSSFNRDWKSTAATPGATGMAGCWDGDWRSDANGHHGRLRAIATPIGPDQYRVRFRANYAGIFRFNYAMDMAVRRDRDGQSGFEGEANLGLWGVYRCAGTLGTNTLQARYDATHDQGVFRLNRFPPNSQ